MLKVLLDGYKRDLMTIYLDNIGIYSKGKRNYSKRAESF
jgi:hypothetical protein